MVVVAGALVAAGSVAAAPVGRLLLAPAGEAVKDSYIVVLKPDRVAPTAVSAAARRLTLGQRGRIGRVFTDALRGFQVTVDEAAARRLAADPAVGYVEQDTVVRLMTGGTQILPPNSGLDRIDQLRRPENGSYVYPTTASDVRVYVIDSGIRATHVDFGGRVSPGYNVHTGGPGTDDCDGHGTHVAGIVGSATYGVAKGVNLVPVNVFGCANNATASAIIAGVDWVTAHHQPGERAVVNMSLGGSPNTAMEQAINLSMRDGLVYTVAAGNGSSDACRFSPARIYGVLTVGATDLAVANRDSIIRPTNSTNIGPCVDIYAPGFPFINSTWSSSDTATNSLAGTSMSAPFAAGVAAMVWSLHPHRPASQITDDVAHMAGHGVVSDYTGGPNRNLYIPAIVISGLPEFNGFYGDAFSTQLTATGFHPPYTWSATGLPAFSSLDPNTGAFSSLPLPGTYTVTITARDAAGNTGSATAIWNIGVPCIAAC